MPIRLMIADDHEVIRAGVTALVSNSGIQVVAEATNGLQAVEEAGKAKADVILLDVRMPELDGLDALEKIAEKNPAQKVVVFSESDNSTYVARAVALGAVGYVLKGASKDELVTAIQRAAKGEPSESPLMSKVRETMARRRSGIDEDMPLTNREVQVLRHVAMGLSNREIGKSLTISIETVKEHVQNILRKLEANDRTQAAVWAVKRGLV